MIRIETKRSKIRNYEIEDVNDYYDYMCLEHTASQEDFEPFNYQQCEEAVVGRLKDDSYMVAEFKEAKKVIGDLHRDYIKNMEIRKILLCGNGLLYQRATLGEEFGSSAVKQACEYIFENTEIIRIFAELFSHKIISC